MYDYQQGKKFKVTKKDKGKKLVLKRSRTRLYFIDTIKRKKFITMVTTVEEKQKRNTKRSLARAKLRENLKI